MSTKKTKQQKHAERVAEKKHAHEEHEAEIAHEHDDDLIVAPKGSSRLRFVFKEDQRTNPDVHEEHVNIGHSEGVITINA